MLTLFINDLKQFPDKARFISLMIISMLIVLLSTVILFKRLDNLQSSNQIILEIHSKIYDCLYNDQNCSTMNLNQYIENKLVELSQYRGTQQNDINKIKILLKSNIENSSNQISSKLYDELLIALQDLNKKDKTENPSVIVFAISVTFWMMMFLSLFGFLRVHYRNQTNQTVQRV